mmetsp:Transcript_79411/g.97149  ORF Transcript_79411/g.97149 Transcript_79411/m.97149 type:complete len:349 (+) Transcript_79411:49-1095(+)
MSGVSKFCSGQYLEITQFIILGIFLLITFIPYFIGIKSLCNNNEKLQKKFSISFILVGLLYFGFIIGSIMAVYSCYYIGDYMSRIFRIVSVWSYILEVSLSTIMISLRFIIPFRNIANNVNINIKFVLIYQIGILIFCLVGCPGLYLAAMYTEINNDLYFIGSMLITASYVIYLVSFILILRTFVKALISFVIQRQRIKTGEASKFMRQASRNTVVKKMSMSDKKFIQLATKYFVLALTIFLTTVFSVIMSGIQSRIKTYLVTNLVNFACLLDGGINFFATFLQYKFSKKSYNYTCNRCDKCVSVLIYKRVYNNTRHSNIENTIELASNTKTPSTFASQTPTETNVTV